MFTGGLRKPAASFFFRMRGHARGGHLCFGELQSFLVLAAFWCPEKGLKLTGRGRSEHKRQTYGKGRKCWNLLGNSEVQEGNQDGAHDRT